MINRNYGKFTDAQFEFAYKPMIINSEWHSNPSDKLLIELGYKPIEYMPMPVKEGYYYTSSFENRLNKIIQIWEEHKIPEEDNLI